MIRRSLALLSVAVGVASLSGCTTSGRMTDTPRTATEQLILDQSLAQTVAHARINIPAGRSVAIETYGLSPDTVPDKAFVQAGITRWLGKQGLRIPGDKNEQYLLRVMIHAFGTNSNEFFFGIPPVTGSLFPISLPEMAFYKSSTQSAFTRFTIDIYERASGKYLASTPTYEGHTYVRGATAFFFITFGSSNLSPGVP
ncbi:hypothetical protein ACW73L_20395 [Methylolobus aquaticus]|uniref:hypothetical protein n=1 Tax=Methylotetracoccus oryzae TaxID=1919059 RepID=UPI00111A635E|nr:hypothetical protein [Methylotetracoccus oryzae]